MDKISSYPLRLLEADARAESNWARAPKHWTRPSDWRHSQCVGRPYGPILADLEQFQNCTDFRITAPFSQNEIARFFQRLVISKITYLIN